MTLGQYHLFHFFKSTTFLQPFQLSQIQEILSMTKKMTMTEMFLAFQWEAFEVQVIFITCTHRTQLKVKSIHLFVKECLL